VSGLALLTATIRLGSTRRIGAITADVTARIGDGPLLAGQRRSHCDPFLPVANFRSNDGSTTLTGRSLVPGQKAGAGESVHRRSRGPRWRLSSSFPITGSRAIDPEWKDESPQSGHRTQ
jgi:hypothetical protein